MNESLSNATSTKTQKLRQTKESLGPLTTEIIKADSYPEAHRVLAGSIKDKIQVLAKSKENKSKPKDKELVKKCLAKMIAKQEELIITKPQIANLIAEYLQSITAWAEGADISLDTALLLQNDNVGCQTFSVRGNQGEVFFGHTEEDGDDNRIDKARWLTFQIGGEERQAFVYPDLLPGPAFSFTNGCFMAVDALYCSPSNQQKEEGGFLANAATWMIWRSGNPEQAEEIINSVGPFYDGYAVNLIYHKNNLPNSKTLEFIGDSGAIVRELEFKKGAVNIQVNCSSIKAIDRLRPNEDLDQENLSSLNNRARIINRALTLVQKITEVKTTDFSPEVIRRILSFRLGDQNWPSLAAPFCRGHVAGRLSQSGFEMLIDSGPALKDSKSTRFFGRETLKQS